MQFYYQIYFLYYLIFQKKHHFHIIRHCHMYPFAVIVSAISNTGSQTHLYNDSEQ